MLYLEKFAQGDDFTLKTETAKFGCRKSFSKAAGCCLTAENAETIPVRLYPDFRSQ